MMTSECKQVGKKSRRLMQAGEMDSVPQEGLMHNAPYRCTHTKMGLSYIQLCASQRWFPTATGKQVPSVSLSVRAYCHPGALHPLNHVLAFPLCKRDVY